jgi:hypothetical protein
MLIGIDFDNTIVDYDSVFSYAADDMGFIPAGQTLTKAQTKALLLARGEGGEQAWQRLQGRVYGYYIDQATVFEGFATFSARMRARGHRLSIISHKTEFGHYDPDRINLRTAALAWMEKRAFFAPAPVGLAFQPEEIHFQPSRDEKITKIAALGCDVFIDDLPEVLLHPDFPTATRPYLFDPHDRHGNCDLSRHQSWKSLTLEMDP